MIKRSAIVLGILIATFAHGQTGGAASPGAGSLQHAPPLSTAVGDGRYAQLASLKKNGWFFAGILPVLNGAGGQCGSGVKQFWVRNSYLAPYNLTSVRAAYANFYNSGAAPTTNAETPSPTALRVKTVWRNQGTAVTRTASDNLFRATLNGKEFGLVPNNAIVLTDPSPLTVAAGARFFCESYADIYMGVAPSAPSATPATTGGALGNGTWYLAMTLVYADGTETPPVVFSEAVSSGSTGSIAVTSPSYVSGFVGYRIYLAGAVGGSSSQTCYENSPPCVPFGTNYAVTTNGYNSSYPNTFAQVSGTPLIPTGGMVSGLYTFHGAVTVQETGEALSTTADLTPAQTVAASNNSLRFAPSFILAQSQDGLLHPSLSIIGDSIAAGVGDLGFCDGAATGGGFWNRACLNQTTGYPYDGSKTIAMGTANFCEPGETASALAGQIYSSNRMLWSALGTGVLCEAGHNDLFSTQASTSATVYQSLLTLYNYYAGQGVFFYQTTLTPQTATSDGWQTVTSQTITTGSAEAYRRQLNNSITDAASVTACGPETPLGGVAGSWTPSTNLYAGGDGTTTQFFPSRAFKEGTEVVKVNGTTQTEGTSYTYIGAQTISGVTYACGIAFAVAPTTGYTVTMQYTCIPPLASWGAYWGGHVDITATVEVNGSGALAFGGGFWHAADSTGPSLTITGTSSNTVTVSNTVTQDQYRGWILYVSADSSTPAAVGQANAIQSNTSAGVLDAATWTHTPDAGATILLYAGYTIDGTHPSSPAAMHIAAGVNTLISSGFFNLIPVAGLWDDSYVLMGDDLHLNGLIKRNSAFAF